jgi:hypothetical protein
VARRFLPARANDLARDQLGSIRQIYLRSNRIVRRGDFADYDETVLLLHGFFQTRNVWEVMEDRLRYDGYGVFSFDLGGLFSRFNTRNIGELAETIAAKIASSASTSSGTRRAGSSRATTSSITAATAEQRASSRSAPRTMAHPPH